MGSVACPHCGQTMYDGLSRCPHCGGPVLTERYEKEIRISIENTQKKEKIWFWASIIAGSLLFVIGLVPYFPLILSGKILPILWDLIVSYCILVSFAYSVHCFHPVRRLGHLGERSGFYVFFSFFFLYMAVAFLAAFAGCVLGPFYYMPRAIIRLCKKQNLITEEEIWDQVQKGYIIA